MADIGGDEPHVTELLGLYYLDTLGPAEGLHIEAHLPACDRCREDAQQVIDTIAALALLSERDRDEVLDTFGALNRTGPPSARFVRFFAPEPEPEEEAGDEPGGRNGGRRPHRLPFRRRRAAAPAPEPAAPPPVAASPVVTPPPVTPPPDVGPAVAPPPVTPPDVEPAVAASPVVVRPVAPPPVAPAPIVPPPVAPAPVSKPAVVTPPVVGKPVVVPAPEPVGPAPAAPTPVSAAKQPVPVQPPAPVERPVPVQPSATVQPPPPVVVPLALPKGPTPRREELVREPPSSRREPVAEKPVTEPVPPAPPKLPPPRLSEAPEPYPPSRRELVRPRARSRRRTALLRMSGLLTLVLVIGGLALGALLRGDRGTVSAPVPVITAAATAADSATGASLSVFVTQQEAGVAVRATVDGLRSGAGYRLQAVTSDGHAWPVVNWTSDGKLQEMTAEVQVPLSTLVFFTVSPAGSGPVVSAYLGAGGTR